MAAQHNEKTPLYYDAFLVRIWSDNASADWRATVEHARSGKQETFASIEQFITFMQKKANLSIIQSSTKDIK